MADTNLGRVVPLHKGTYSASETYELNDIVSADGSLYWHWLDAETTGRAPTDTAVWRLVVSLAEAEAYIQRAEVAQEAAEAAQEAAAGSAATASQKATAAAGSAAAAEASQEAAEAAQEAAEAAQEAAEAAENAAAGSAETASQKATAAAESATAAETAQTAAEVAQGAAEAAQEAAEAATESKADKVTGATAGNLAALDEDGNIVDAGISTAGITAALAEKAAQADMTTQEALANFTYQGTDLTQKFATEIATSPYSGDPWAWIRARIRAGDFTGIHVNDYIPFTTTNSISLKACVGGINTYKDYGDTAVGNHIDFICRELWPTRKPLNPANYNNGLIPVETITGDGSKTSFVLTKEMSGISSVTQGAEGLTGYTYNASTFTLTFAEAPAAGTITVTGTGTECPWLASDLYHWLNSLSGQVPNGAGLNPAVKHVDYTQGGVFYYLPTNLKNVIVEKHMLLPKRYSASGVLSNDNSASWENAGKLWLPMEWEVYGSPIWSTKDYGASGSAVQYPIFAHNMNRVKNRSGSRDGWWVLSARSDSITAWCRVYPDGSANYNSAATTYVAAPVCFRIA